METSDIALYKVIRNGNTKR